MSPILLLNRPWKNQQSQEVEAFGPVSTLMPYKDIDDAVALTKLGKAAFCASIATYDKQVAQQFVWGRPATTAACWRPNRDMAKENTGHGSAGHAGARRSRPRRRWRGDGRQARRALPAAYRHPGQPHRHHRPHPAVPAGREVSHRRRAPFRLPSRN